MEIKFKRHPFYQLIYEDQNIRVEEDVEERSTRVNAPTSGINSTDISNEVLEKYVSVLDDLIHFRSNTFDSSELIERLFDKLPEDKRAKLFFDLNNNYEFITTH